jgi:hypothetical protein
LREVDQAGETDDGAVDLAEGFEAEYFGCVIPISSQHQLTSKCRKKEIWRG